MKKKNDKPKVVLKLNEREADLIARSLQHAVKRISLDKLESDYKGKKHLILNPCSFSAYNPYYGKEWEEEIGILGEIIKKIKGDL